MRLRARVVGTGVRQRVRAAAARGLAAALLTLIGFANARAGPADHKYLSLRGSVADSDGTPLAGVTVEASGTRQVSSVTGADGRYQMSLDLGTLLIMRDHPAAIWIRARKDGWRIRVAGGAPSLAIELSVVTTGPQPQMVARSNFGLMADAMLDALAPSGDRTASIQTVFAAERGAEVDSMVPLTAQQRFAVLVEPWLMSAPASTAKSVPSSAKSKATPAKLATPAPSSAARDSAKRAHEAEERLRSAAAIATRDSAWMAQRAVALSQRMLQDSLRAIREAAEDSARHAHAAPAQAKAAAPAAAKSTVPAASPAPTATKSTASTKSATSAKSGTHGKSAAAPATSSVAVVKTARVGDPSHPDHDRHRSTDAAVLAVRPRTSWSELSGLSRVQPGGSRLDTVAVDVMGSPVTYGGPDCSCRVKGTVELEFHHLLANPMRVEVAILDTAIRDTVQLFMGSPRAFDFARVPCGHLSIRISAFSQREFDVITPDQVAPFDCHDGGLRQVRIVIAPR